MVEHLYLSASVLFAIALSAGLATDRVRQRATATAAIVLTSTYLAWAVQPQLDSLIQLAGLTLVAVLFTACLTAYLRSGLRALGIVLFAGTALVVTLQTSVFPLIPPGEVPVYPRTTLPDSKPTHQIIKAPFCNLRQ